jgi:hypothetical protein
MPDPSALQRLEADGLVRREDGAARTTRRWQAAVARAALRLLAAGAPAEDLRLPVATAMIELYPGCSDLEIAELVEAIAPVEARELAPRPSPR